VPHREHRVPHLAKWWLLLQESRKIILINIWQVQSIPSMNNHDNFTTGIARNRSKGKGGEAERSAIRPVEEKKSKTPARRMW
jgi:hypothetical protein